MARSRPGCPDQLPTRHPDACCARRPLYPRRPNPSGPTLPCFGHTPCVGGLLAPCVPTCSGKMTSGLRGSGSETETLPVPQVLSPHWCASRAELVHIMPTFKVEKLRENNGFSWGLLALKPSASSWRPRRSPALHFPAVWLWASCLPSLCLSSLI